MKRNSDKDTKPRLSQTSPLASTTFPSAATPPLPPLPSSPFIVREERGRGSSERASRVAAPSPRSAMASPRAGTWSSMASSASPQSRAMGTGRRRMPSACFCSPRMPLVKVHAHTHHQRCCWSYLTAEQRHTFLPAPRRLPLHDKDEAIGWI